MIRGLYTSASGMLVEMTRTDIISNNLANANTTSFKKDLTVFRASPQMRIHRLDDPVKVGKRTVDPRPFIGVLGTGAAVDATYTDFSSGKIINTDNPLDLAIGGEGFFQVETPAGIRYTRDGSFSIDAQGYLVTREGYRVLGELGPIEIPPEGEISVDTQGYLRWNGEVLDRISLVNFQDTELLVKQGDNLYDTQEAPGPFDGEVISGALEGSNINVVSEMVDLISAFRAYEASQKVLRANDKTLGRAVNDILKI